jgi:hypothetical protein
MDRKIAALMVLGVILVPIVMLLPPEKSLGNSYKFIYVHLPMSIIVLGSVMLYPIIILAFRNTELSALTFTIVTFLFSIAQILVSMLFMQFAWSGIAFYEPRMLFNLAIVVILAGSVALRFLEQKLAFSYSLAVPILAIWVYYSIMSNYTFQLHPESFVKMNVLLLSPFVIAIPFFGLLYIVTFEKIRVILKKLSEHGQLPLQKL